VILREQVVVTLEQDKSRLRANKDLVEMPSNNQQHRQQVVSHLKPLCNNKKQWDAFCEYLDIIISDQHKKLEQLDNVTQIHQSQGAIQVLRSMKYLREEALADG
jgi:hypothetical protein